MPFVTETSSRLYDLADCISAKTADLCSPFTFEAVASLVSLLASNLPVKRAFIFGSYARGEQTASSDLDVVLEPDHGFGYAELNAFRDAVSTVLGIDCDIVTSLDGASPSFVRALTLEARCVYDKQR